MVEYWLMIVVCFFEFVCLFFICLCVNFFVGSIGSLVGLVACSLAWMVGWLVIMANDNVLMGDYFDIGQKRFTMFDTG